MIYIGGYENDSNQGIYELNEDLTCRKQICKELQTSYFDVDETSVVTIMKRNGFGGVAIYDLNGHLICDVMTKYAPACFIKKYKKRIYVAYYHDQCVQVYDESLNLIHELTYQSGAKCHFVGFLNNMFYVICLGLDTIYFYDYNFCELSMMKFPTSSGPRHAVVTHDEKVMYVLSELSNELFVVDMNQRQIKQTLSIKLNQDETIGAAIALSHNEKHLYTTTRGQDLLKHFMIEDKVREVQCIHLEGSFPRDFCLLEDCILVGYQNSHFVEKIYLDKGMITNKKERIAYDKIVCIKTL
ncbi:MAG: beta-propeller fold lactonase family protein [Traorella sp.]